MRRRAEITLSFELDVDPEALWARITDPAGINDELRPLMRMTVPAGARDFGLDDPEPGPIGRSWLLLFGFLPFDYDDLVLVQLEPGRGFHEGSTMLSMRSWEHERWIEPAGEAACTLRDRLTFVPRLPLPLTPAVRAVFRHRHRRLRKRFGGAPA